jgi:hypothetical protein
MTNNPHFVYAMVPRGASSFKNFFEAGPIHELLEKPGELRYACWDLNTRDQAKIVKGEFLELKSGERKLIRLYEDGSLIVRADASESFLGWGRGEVEFKQKPRLNPVAVVEFTYNFVNLCAKLVKFLEPNPKSVGIRVEIRNAFFENSKLYMIPYGTGTYAWLFDDEQYKAPESSMVREIDVSIDELASRPGTVAYSLAEKIYTWFGISTEKIPYVSAEGDKKFVDPQKIINSKP